LNDADHRIIEAVAAKHGLGDTDVVRMALRALAREEGIPVAKTYITLDERNQLATGPDWPELEADGNARLQAEIDRQKAEADAVREWDRTHDGITGDLLQ
jgi:antitoxin component of RelBE/YafQ-DinJ toxin-antitoxin module